MKKNVYYLKCGLHHNYSKFMFKCRKSILAKIRRDVNRGYFEEKEILWNACQTKSYVPWSG